MKYNAYKFLTIAFASFTPTGKVLLILSTQFGAV